ncbi:MAG: SCP2 sterol-binding domain-containing protein [Oscillospiraceae bacterium]
MPSQKIVDYCNKVREITNSKHLVGLPTYGAIEIHIKEFEPEPFYIEVKNGKVSIEPYEYINKDAIVFSDLQTTQDIFYKNISVSDAISTKKIVVDGDAEILYCLQRNM